MLCQQHFSRLNGYEFNVEAISAHGFLISLFETDACDLQHLLPWLRRSMITI